MHFFSASSSINNAQRSTRIKMGNVESDFNDTSDSQPTNSQEPQPQAKQPTGQEKKQASKQKPDNSKKGPPNQGPSSQVLPNQGRNRSKEAQRTSKETPTTVPKAVLPPKSADILSKDYRYSFQFEVKNFSGKNEHVSQVAFFDDCHWQLVIQVIQVKNQWNVTAYLRCLTIKGHPQRKVCTSFRVGIVKQDISQEPTYSKNQYFIFSNDLKPKKVAFQDAFGDSGKKAALLNPTLGFIKNNSIIFQVDVNTFSAKTRDTALTKSFWLPWDAIYPDVTFLVGVNKNPIKVHRQIMAMNCSF